MDNFFSSPDLYDDLAHKKIFCCGTVRLHRKGMPKDLKPKTLRLKRGDIRVRTRGDLTAMVWKNKRDMCLLTNIHDPPREGNYHNEHRNVIKLAIVADYNRHMGQVDNSDRLANSYMASRRTWKWKKKLFFPPVRPGHCQQLHPFIFIWWEENFTQEIFVSPLSQRCWHGLGMSHDHPCLWEDQPQLLLTSEDWTHVTISTGLAAILNSGVVVCVQRGA